MGESMGTELTKNVEKALDLIIPEIRTQLKSQRRPIVIGITGLQGSGTSTWAEAVVKVLSSKRHLKAISVSLDDFYKTHDDLITLRERNPNNRLLRTRGQPGTHDEHLAASFFASLHENSAAVSIPVFDKSAFNGEGDRSPPSTWPLIKGPVDVVVFEGWCVGFTPLPDNDIGQRRSRAMAMSMNDSPTKPLHTLANHALQHLQDLNQNLGRYCDTFMGPKHFDHMIQLDTNDLVNVYDWRLEQEQALMQSKGMAMTEDEVRAFVEGYMPAYELYQDGLRKGLFGTCGSGKHHVRVLLSAQR